GSFSMTQYARVVEAIDDAGAKRVFVDFYFDRRENDKDFARFTAAIRRMGDRAILAVATKAVPGTDRNRSIFPSPAFGPAAKRASIAWDDEFWQVWRLPTAYVADGQVLPSFSSLLADKPGNRPELFRLDFSYDTASIKQYSAMNLLSGL